MPAPTDSDLIDVVDDHDVVVGTTPRGNVRAEGVNFRVAHIFVFNEQGNLLLQQLGTERTLQPGRWGSSVAAHLWAGESYADAAARRLPEELGISTDLHPVSVIPVNDANSIKFVGLFTTTSDVAENQEPAHIAALEFRPVSQVAVQVEDQPDQFSDTFRVLFEAYRVSQH